MNYVIAKIDGKQIKLSEGQVLKLNSQKDLNLEIIASIMDGNIDLEPKSLSVDLERLEDKKDKKIRVVRFKSKSRYRKLKGHRQPISIVKVGKVGESKPKTKKATAKVEKEETN